MRVIGGELRGRKLTAPASASVRPTLDRVREAVFDILYSRGGVDGRSVLDLFAGSGAMGIEALSRGATHVTFVDQDPLAISTIRDNLAGVGLSEAEGDGDATIIRADAPTWLTRTEARFDLALCDPPYGFNQWPALIASLPVDLAVLESGSEVAVPDGWESLKSKRYGGTIVTVVRPFRTA